MDKILPLLTGFILMASASSAPCGVVLDKVVAVVNNEAVTWSELYREMEFELSRSEKALGGGDKMETFKKNEHVFLERIIDKRVQLQEAADKGIRLSPDDVDRAIKSIRQKYGLDEGAFSEAIQEEGFTMEKYMEMLAEQIVIGRLVEREVREKITISEDELERYLRERDIERGRHYRISHIYIDKKGGAERARGRADEVLKRLESGEDFADLAAVYSDDPAAGSGGDMGFIQEENISSDFRLALEAMSPGDVSPPIETPKGIHIILLEDLRDASDLLGEEIFEAKYLDWLRGLREKSFIEIRL